MKTNGSNEKLLYFALPVVILAACVLGPGLAQAQMTSTGIDCSEIASDHLLVQDNQRAGLALMECGVIPRPVAANSGDDVSGDEPQPPNILVSNRSCSSGSSCTKSESMVSHSAKAGDNTVVVNYNDHDGSGYSGVSYSTDGGSTFTEIMPPPFDNGHGTNYGDPIVVYNLKLGMWFAGDLVPAAVVKASACGPLPTAKTGALAPAPTTTPSTTASPCGWTTTHSARRTAACTFPGITTTSAAALVDASSLPTPTTA